MRYHSSGDRGFMIALLLAVFSTWLLALAMVRGRQCKGAQNYWRFGTCLTALAQ
jgi:hypothetical protein